MSKSYMEEYQRWLDSPALSEEEWKELNSIAGDEKEIENRFYAPLEFGTAGLRGTMKLGLHNMNIHIIRHATQAFANVILADGEDAKSRGIVIAHDCRLNGVEFSKEAACVMAANGIPRTLSAAFLALLVAFAVFGGQKRIAGVSAAIVPAAGAVYLVLALFMLIRGAHELPRVFRDIFAAAFGLRQAVGGTLGVSVSAAISVGLTRCIFSNEAGMGTSPMAHSSAESVLPSAQGLMGVAEIIADTFVFSTVTALALLCHGTTDVYELFAGECGMFGRIVLPVLLVIFAYAAIIAWCYYAESCIAFLFPHSCGAALTVYRLLSVACVFAGVMVVSQSVWDIADILNVLMMIPNIFDLITKRKEILRWTGTK